MTNVVQQKIKSFHIAIDKYNNNIIYNKIGTMVSFIIVSLQMILLYNTYNLYDLQQSIITTIIIFFIAYLITDFINGLIHLYMDNNSNYDSKAGPFIAAFHLHHRNIKYKNRPFYMVYFYESGAKLWLPIYLIFVLYLQTYIGISFYLSFCLTSFGILSSFAEVSHYWCHNSSKDDWLISILQKYKIILPKAHHKQHHRHDNINYAFLNGSTDVVINIIAKRYFGGYKNNTDLHARAYTGIDTSNRE